MELDSAAAIHISATLAILGSIAYGIGDILMLAPQIGPRSAVAAETFAGLRQPQRRIDMLVGLAELPAWRLTAGGLLGVFAAPLVLVGLLLLYRALEPAGAWLALPPVLLTLYATVIGPFIHGAFIFLGDDARTLASVDKAAQPLIAERLTRHLRLLMVCYAVLFSCAIAASIWFAVAVAGGQTRLPIWMALANPLLLAVAWFGIRTVLPRRVREATRGAGLNIANLAFLALLAAAIW